MKSEGRWAVGPIGCSLEEWGAGKYQRQVVPFGKVLQEWKTRYAVKDEISLRHHRYELQRPKKVAIVLPKVLVLAVAVNGWKTIVIPAQDRQTRCARVFFLFVVGVLVSNEDNHIQYCVLL